MAKCTVDVEMPDGKYCFTDKPKNFIPCVFYWQSEDGEEGCGLLNKRAEQKPNTLNCEKWDGCPNKSINCLGVKHKNFNKMILWAVLFSLSIFIACQIYVAYYRAEYYREEIIWLDQVNGFANK